MDLSVYLTLNGGLRALLLGEGKDVFVCSVPCPVGEDVACLLLNSKEFFWYFLGLI